MGTAARYADADPHRGAHPHADTDSSAAHGHTNADCGASYGHTNSDSGASHGHTNADFGASYGHTHGGGVGDACHARANTHAVAVRVRIGPIAWASAMRSFDLPCSMAYTGRALAC